jgi:hypothetical protein
LTDRINRRAHGVCQTAQKKTKGTKSSLTSLASVQFWSD